MIVNGNKKRVNPEKVVVLGEAQRQSGCHCDCAGGCDWENQSERRRRKMSETRPVPRRESPWGLPEGDHRQPKAHRCNDRAEDVIQVFHTS